MAPMNLRPWLQATRPKTLAAGAVPVLVGTACAAEYVGLQWGAAALCLIGAILIQIGCNYANDAFDALQGADTAERLGPTRAVASGLISAKAMLLATALVLLVAFGLGCYLSTFAGWPIFAIGVASLLAAVAYTAKPFALAYRGLGDVFVLIFFGFVAVLGTAWTCFCAGGSSESLAGPMGLPISWWLLAAAVGLQATAILVVNNLRDRQTDAATGKRTLAVRMPPAMTRAYYGCLHGLAIACLVGTWWLSKQQTLWIPITIASLGGLLLTIAITRHDGVALNPWLARTAAVELLTGLSLSFCLAWQYRQPETAATMTAHGISDETKISKARQATPSRYHQQLQVFRSAWSH